jgi:hypothetical protein
MLPLAISDTAQVLISLGPALIAGAVGYFGARLQYQVGESAREAEARTLRKNVYHGYLNSVLAELRHWSRAEPVTPDQLLEIQREGHMRLSEVFLVASDEVVAAANAWSTLASTVDRRANELAERYLGERNRQEALNAALDGAFAEHRDEVDAANDRLIGAMRQDVGPSKLY